MGNDLIEIKYIPLDDNSKIKLHRTLKELSEALGKKCNYESTNIAGIYEDNLFTIYKDKNDNKKICVIFIGKNEQRIIYINSDDIKQFLSKCNYYYEYDKQTGLSIETSGLKFMSRKYCKFEWQKKEKNYTIILSENPNNRSYQYEMILQNETEKKRIIYTWDSYQQFLKNEKPKQILLSDTEDEYITIPITDNGTYVLNDTEKSYEQIKKLIEYLGLNLNINGPRRYVSSGVSINIGLMEIINKYLECEQQLETQETIKQETEIKENRKEISMSTNPSPTKEENIFIELGTITKRHAIRKIDNRNDRRIIKK